MVPVGDMQVALFGFCISRMKLDISNYCCIVNVWKKKQRESSETCKALSEKQKEWFLFWYLLLYSRQLVNKNHSLLVILKSLKNFALSWQRPWRYNMNYAGIVQSCSV